MNPSLEITADPAAIQKAASQAGHFFAAQLDELLTNPALDDLQTLDYVHGGRNVKIMVVRVSPYLNGLSAVRPLQRTCLISAEPGNENHLAKLTTAVRRAMENRDPSAAAREIRELGSPVGFDVAVVGV